MQIEEKNQKIILFGKSMVSKVGKNGLRPATAHKRNSAKAKLLKGSWAGFRILGYGLEMTVYS